MMKSGFLQKGRLSEHRARSMNSVTQFYDVPEEDQVRGEPDLN